MAASQAGSALLREREFMQVLTLEFIIGERQRLAGRDRRSSSAGIRERIDNPVIFNAHAYMPNGG